MLSLRNSEVEEIFAWFEHCYDVEVHSTTGRPYWKRVALPGDGGIGTQDARLIHGLTYMASVQQQVLNERLARQAREQAEAAKKRHG